MKAIALLLLVTATGFGWIEFERRNPFVFKMLDDYSESQRLRERNDRIRKGLEDIEKRTGAKLPIDPLLQESLQND